MIKMIFASDLNGAIGRENKLIYPLKKDLIFFKNTTIWCDVLMGKRTFESIWKILPWRKNIVVSTSLRKKDLKNLWDLSNLKIIKGVNFNKIKSQYKWKNNPDLFVIGGKTMYDLFHKSWLVEEIYITIIKKKARGKDLVKLDLEDYSNSYYFTQISEDTENWISFKIMKWVEDKF